MAQPAPSTPTPIPVFASFIDGMRLCAENIRLFAVLSFFPLAVTLATMVALRLFKGTVTMFMLPIVQFPSSFVIGLQCALILRFLLLKEYPLVPQGAAKTQRNRSVTQAAFVYAAITYFITGAYAGLLQARGFLTDNPEAAAPWAPLIMAGLVLLLWAARWFWLHIPVVAGWDVPGFFRRIGGWGGSLRIFALFALCSLVVNFATGFIHLLISVVSDQQKELTGFAAAFYDGVVAMATVLLAVLFTTSSAAAVKYLQDKKTKAQNDED